MSKYQPLRRCRDGVVRCNAHATSGAPRFHTDGCVDCQAARARGIVRPDATGLTADQRRSLGFRMTVGASR